MQKWLFLFLIFFGCAKTPESQREKPKVLVTIAPYTTFTKAIAGDTVDVEVLIPPGVDLHTYEPSPKKVEETVDATVWFRIDEPIERRILRFLYEQNPDQKIVNLQTGLPLIKDSVIELGDCMGHDHSGEDLHTWMTPRLARIQAKTMFETLVTLFPEHEKLYTNNFSKLNLKFVALEKELDLILGPVRGDAILISHPSLGYFCHDYDLIQLSVECEGKEPRPRDVEDILALTERYTVRVAFVQPGINNKGAELIAKRIGVPIHTIDPFSPDYFQNIRSIAEVIGD